MKRMRVLRIGMIVAAGLGAFAVDVEESSESGRISVGSAHAKPHRRHHRKHARPRHRKRHHSPPPATEM